MRSASTAILIATGLLLTAAPGHAFPSHLGLLRLVDDLARLERVFEDPFFHLEYSHPAITGAANAPLAKTVGKDEPQAASWDAVTDSAAERERALGHVFSHGPHLDIATFKDRFEVACDM
jgi:hypothetical protein